MPKHKFDRDEYKARNAARAKAKTDNAAAKNVPDIRAAVATLMQALGL